VAQLQGVSKVYGSGEMAVKALDQLNLCVNRGDYLAVMGASGSGKSTAMNILCCLDRPSSGSYRLIDIPVEQLSDDQLADLRNRDLGFVFQQFQLLPQLNALVNVMVPMVYAGVPAAERRQRAQAALERALSYPDELFVDDELDARAAATGLGPQRSALREAWQAEVWAVLDEATLALPAASKFVSTGSRGVHSEHMGFILAEMQHLQRAFPGGVW
jgi:predicted ABC-type transport system involved in lysophospholipase L1 biosynthesis ATPase subunit